MSREIAGTWGVAPSLVWSIGSGVLADQLSCPRTKPTPILLVGRRLDLPGVHASEAVVLQGLGIQAPSRIEWLHAGGRRFRQCMQPLPAK